jgi:phosphate transport system substrate-binding protein
MHPTERTAVELQRYGRLAAVTLAGTLALGACGSDNNSAPSASGGTGGDSATSGASAPTGGSGNSGAPAYCATGTLTVSGSSAQANAMTQWIKDYQTACTGATVNYAPVGSGQGIIDFTNGQSAFAGSDSALKPEEKGPADKRCKTGKAIDLPMVPGPIAVVFNVDGVDKLTLTPQVLAKIFSGKVTTWNDPAIAGLNKGAKLPSETIATFHRSDDSGTSDNFTKYLATAAASDWSYGNDKVWKAPGGQGAKGSDGISAAIEQTPNSLSYVEYSYATQNDLTLAAVDNGRGPVQLSTGSVGKAIEAAKVAGKGNDLALDLDYTTKAKGAYPIILVTYEIACESGLPAEQAKLTKGFLTYAVSDKGQQKLTDLGYAPLPKSIQTKVASAVAALS